MSMREEDLVIGRVYVGLHSRIVKLLMVGPRAVQIRCVNHCTMTFRLPMSDFLGLYGPLGCDPGCIPAAPCMAPNCPGHAELEVEASMWSAQQRGKSLLCDCDCCRLDRKSPAPELRCDRGLACGLYRST